MIVAALVVPFVVGLLLMFGRRFASGRAAAWLGAAAMSVSLVLVAAAWDGREGVSGEVDVAWIDPIGARLHLGFTAVSWPFALMTAFVAILCCLWLVADDTSPALVGLVLVISASALGVFSSLDALLLFVFFELALVPMWFVIAWWSDADRVVAQRAATRFLLFTVTGSALLLVGIVVSALQGGTLDLVDLRPTAVATVLVTLGFAVKTPVVPLHTWLPDAHSSAPTVGSVLLASVFLKLGTYGLIVFVVPSEHVGVVAPYLAVAGALGIVWAALACYAQDDLKRLIAYSSVGHMGFVVLAIATRSEVGVAAAVFGSVAHGVVTALLFFAAGSMKDRYGTSAMSRIGRGLYGRAPWLAATFVLAAVASLGLPGLAGFWGEVLTLRAAYDVGDVLTRPVAWTGLGLALLGIAVTTAYVVRAVRLLAQGEPTPLETDRDLGRREAVVMGALVVAILVLGLVPQLVLDLYEPVYVGVAR